MAMKEVPFDHDGVSSSRRIPTNQPSNERLHDMADMAAPPRDDESLTVGILLFDQVEELDFCGPYEAFAVASFHAMAHTKRERPALTVCTVAERPDLVRTGGGLRVQPDYTFADAPPIDIL